MKWELLSPFTDEVTEWNRDHDGKEWPIIKGDESLRNTALNLTMKHYHKREWRHWSGWRATEEFIKTQVIHGASLVVQWLRLHIPNAGGTGSIPGELRSHLLKGMAKKKKKKIAIIQTHQYRIWFHRSELNSRNLNLYLPTWDILISSFRIQGAEKSELPKIWET